MKKFVFPAIASVMAATNAFAADLPRKALPPVAPVVLPTFTWTGFYVGVNAGAAWGTSTAKSQEAVGEDFNAILKEYSLDKVKYTSNGFAGGGQVGYNYQFAPGNSFVIGVEADLDYVGFNKKKHWTKPNNFTMSDYILTNDAAIDTRNDMGFLGTARGRLGYAVDRVMFYGTGGLAYGQVNYRNKFAIDYAGYASDGTKLFSGRDVYETRKSDTQTGFAYGGGIEYALPADSFLNLLRSNAVTLKAEYLHYDLGTRKISQLDSAGKSILYTTKIKTEGDIVRAGLNFKFGL